MIRIRGQSFCFLGIITISYLFCFLFPNTFASSPTSILCRPDQRNALLELQKEFLITSWNKSVDCCSWKGITCDTILGVVISLDLLSNFTANTTLKSGSGLFKLQHLTHLDLSHCHLQGEIPSSFGNLSSLTSLDLSHNVLVGEVPASIGNLNQLEYMYLWSNGLEGNIPTSFVNLTKLSKLKLSGNQFTGGVDLVLPNLTSLSFIDLSYNHFQSSLFVDLSGLQYLEGFIGYSSSFVGPFPSPLFIIPSLVRIYLGRNQFEGPLEFGNMSSSSKLRELDVHENNFDGFIPESISKLRNLEYLNLSQNNLRGKIPRSVSKLRNLSYLDLSHNYFGGQVPRSISKLVNLQALDLSYNKLEGQVPRWSHLYYILLSHNSFSSFDNSKEVIDGSSLYVLELGSNSLQGPISQWICKFRSLWVLDFSNNHFTRSIPQCLVSFTNLMDVNLRNNSFSGFIPNVFNASFLRSLDFSRNNFVGKFPKSLINCKNMEFLNVQGNKIKDTFPFWLGSLQNLNVLLLRSNAFYGPVYNSSAYLGFPSMRIIDISNNNFDGSLPQDYFTSWPEMSNENCQPTYMGNMGYYSIDLAYKGVDTEFSQISTAFKAIDFSGHRFCGHIPKSIGFLNDMRLLNLSDNIFTGNIPPSLANITKLETLDISRNNLTDEIPQGLGKLSFLSNINFSYNHLEGLVPQSTQFGSQNCSSFMVIPNSMALRKFVEKSIMSLFLHPSNLRNLCRNRKSKK